MKKNVFGRRFKRNKNQRKALFKNLMSSLVIKERIKTTEEKAKAIKGQIEKAVTKVNKKGNDARNQLQEYLNGEALEKLIKDVAPRFEKRNGGYTRIVRLGKRFDSSDMVFLEWVEMSSKLAVVEPESKESSKKETKKEESKKVVKKEAKKPVKKDLPAGRQGVKEKKK